MLMGGVFCVERVPDSDGKIKGSVVEKHLVLDALDKQVKVGKHLILDAK